MVRCAEGVVRVEVRFLVRGRGGGLDRHTHGEEEGRASRVCASRVIVMGFVGGLGWVDGYWGGAQEMRGVGVGRNGDGRGSFMENLGRLRDAMARMAGL